MALDYEKVGKAIEHSQNVLLKGWKKLRRLKRTYMGDQHPSGDDKKTTPMNLTKIAAHVYLQQILPGELRSLITARFPEVEAISEGLERGTNERIKETHTGREVGAATHEALLSSIGGIVRVGEETTGIVNFKGVGDVETSATAVRQIATERFFFDVQAEQWPFITFAGDIFTVPLDWAKSFKGFLPKARGKLTSMRLRDVIPGSGPARQVEQQPSDQEYQAQTQIMAVWLPLEGSAGKMAMLVPKSFDLLHEIDWDGPEHGPYHRLSFNDMPGEIEQIAPLELLRHLHAVSNTILVKMMNRIEASKEVALVNASNPEMAEKIIKAEDMAWLLDESSGPEPVKFARMGSIGGDLAAMLIHMRRLFSWQGGNIDLAGGMQAQSETLGQDRILAAAANRTIQEMGKRVEKFARGIVRSLAWYEWTDPIRERVFMRTVEDGGHQYRFPSEWTPATRNGDFLDHDVQVDVYALQHRSPEERLAALQQSLGQIMPLYPLLQAQKGTLDVRELVDLIAKLRDLPELRRIIRGTTQRQPPELSEPPQKTQTQEDRRAVPQRDEELEMAGQLASMGSKGGS